MKRTRSKATRSKRASSMQRASGVASAGGIVAQAGSLARILDLLAHGAVPMLFVLFVWLWHPFHDVFEFDPDEGNEIIKALMLAEGHPLYSETWSDQPPLFTYMLRGWLALTDWTVHQGRLLVLLCAAVLLWALYQIVRPRWGHAAAFAAALMLAASYRYIALSVAVMQAVPTLMFVMLSIWALSRYRQRPHPAWMVASGAFLTLSLFTKMLTLPIAPLIFLAVVYAGWTKRGDAPRKAHWLQPAPWWCGGAVAAGVAVVLVAVPLNEFMQFIRPHLAAQEKMTSQGFDKVFQDMVKADWTVAFLGVVGLLHILWKRNWFSLLAVVWCLMAYVLLWTHRPLWYHHYPLLAIPLCWLAGIGVGALFSSELWRAWLPWRGARSAYALLVLLLALCFCAAAATRIKGKFDREYSYAEAYVRMTASDHYTVAVLKQFKDRTDYAVTDRQMLAFAAGMMVPPELSVTSVKRMRSGSLSMETLIGLLEQYEPGVIHLSWRKRIPLTRELYDYLKTHYSSLYADPRGDRCYVRKTLAVDPVSILERATEEVPAPWEGHLNLGVQLARVGRSADAVRALESSLAIKPTEEAYRGLGQSLKRLGRYQEAARTYEILGQNLKRMKREDEAARALEEAKRLRARGSQ